MLAIAASTLAIISCGPELMDRERIPNLSWCNGGTGIASAWEARPDRVFAMMACEASFPSFWVSYGHPEEHFYKSFETLEDWSDFAER